MSQKVTVIMRARTCTALDRQTGRGYAQGERIGWVVHSEQDLVAG